MGFLREPGWVAVAPPASGNLAGRGHPFSPCHDDLLEFDSGTGNSGPANPEPPTVVLIKQAFARNRRSLQPNPSWGRGFFLAGWLFEQGGRPLAKLGLPGSHLGTLELKLICDLAHRLESFDSFNGDFRFEFRLVISSSSLCHFDFLNGYFILKKTQSGGLKIGGHITCLGQNCIYFPYMISQGSSLLNRITIDPEVCHGKPCIRGLRYPVEWLLDLMSGDMTKAEILEDYPDLEAADLQAALAFAARVVRVKEIAPLSSL